MGRSAGTGVGARWDAFAAAVVVPKVGQMVCHVIADLCIRDSSTRPSCDGTFRNI